MSAPNVWLRDPVLYRIRHAEHHHTGDKWCIYPMYDFAHMPERLHRRHHSSLCTLEFEVHRPLYDWILEPLDLPRPLPHQYEFARLNLTYTVMSKRKLMQLVNEKLVTGWDDPRMPTICRHAPARRHRERAARIRLQHRHHEISEHDRRRRARTCRSARSSIARALRRLAVLRPIKVVITNYPEGQVEELEAINNPEDPDAGHAQDSVQPRAVHRSRRFHGSAAAEIFPAQAGRRSATEIRLHHQVRRSDQGCFGQRHRAPLHAPISRANRAARLPNRKVKGTIHWVSAAHAIDAEVRLYDRLFTVPEPDADGDFKSFLNPHSLEVVTAKCEPRLGDAKPELRYQFERLAYFALDPDSKPGKLVFNRTITLRDTWAKEAKKQ